MQMPARAIRVWGEECEPCQRMLGHRLDTGNRHDSFPIRGGYLIFHVSVIGQISYTRS